MNTLLGRQMIRFLPVIPIVLLFLAACGGGGGTSAGSGGGSNSVARVSGSISTGSLGTDLNIEQRVFDPTGTIVALGHLIIPLAQAQQLVDVEGIVVTVTCTDASGNVVVNESGTTDESGRFDVPVAVTAIVNCTTAFNGVAGPGFTLNPGMQTEIKVAFDGSAVTLLSINQTPGEKTTIVVEDNDSEDDNSSDVVKVTICHKPGTPAEQTKAVPETAVPGHLGHGDSLGACVN